jgi:hypothetical protein
MRRDEAKEMCQSNIAVQCKHYGLELSFVGPVGWRIVMSKLVLGHQVPRVLRLLAVFVCLFTSGCTGGSYVYTVDEGTALTETLAVELSRRALDASGVDTSRATPVPYGGKSGDGAVAELFARNTTDANRGHVLWKIAGQPGEYQYSVAVERTGDRVECRVAPAK